MSNDANCESPATYTVTVPLSGIAIEVLEQLFIMGPTWDGDVVSKSGRDELFDLKLAGRCEGYQFLTLAGMRLALANKVNRKKEVRYRRQRERLYKLDQIEQVLSPTDTAQACGQQSVVMGLQNKTVEGLERLLKPEPDSHE